MRTLVIAEHDNISLKKSTLCTVSAAMQCGHDIDLLIMGHACLPVVKTASRAEGVARVLMADSFSLAHGLAENAAKQILFIANHYSHILAPASSFGKTVLPRVAAKLDVAQISEITRVISSDTFERPIYADSAIMTVQSFDRVKVITVKASAFSPVSLGKNVPVESITVCEDMKKSAFLSRRENKPNHLQLADAKAVVAVGEGIGSLKNIEIIKQLANKLGAAIGASRAAVDRGFVSRDLQVGQTGQTISPSLYIALGISGAIQHIAGMKDAKVIVAINKDANAPIFKAADYGIVGDLHQLVPQFVDLLDN